MLFLFPPFAPKLFYISYLFTLFYAFFFNMGQCSINQSKTLQFGKNAVLLKRSLQTHSYFPPEMQFQ